MVINMLRCIYNIVAKNSTSIYSVEATIDHQTRVGEYTLVVNPMTIEELRVNIQTFLNEQNN